jgi:hypothetical protein
MCEQLNTFASPDWKACSLAIPAFAECAQPPSPLFVLEQAFTLELQKKPVHDAPAYLEAS